MDFVCLFYDGQISFFPLHTEKRRGLLIKAKQSNDNNYEQTKKTTKRERSAQDARALKRIELSDHDIERRCSDDSCMSRFCL